MTGVWLLKDRKMGRRKTAHNLRVMCAYSCTLKPSPYHGLNSLKIENDSHFWPRGLALRFRRFDVSASPFPLNPQPSTLNPSRSTARRLDGSTSFTFAPQPSNQPRIDVTQIVTNITILSYKLLRPFQFFASGCTIFYCNPFTFRPSGRIVTMH